MVRSVQERGCLSAQDENLINYIRRHRMAYYVRKIARAKWALLDSSAEKVIDNYRADAIANDMRTTNDALSFWKAKSLDSADFEPVVIINSLLGDYIKKIDLLCIPEEYLAGFDMKQEDGDTIVYEYRHLHYNLSSLTIKRLVDFARNIVLQILLSAEANSKYVKRINEKQQLELLDKWLTEEKITISELKSKQQEAIIKHRKKKSQN